MANLSKEQKNNNPAPWKPINRQEFNKNADSISGIFKSDPERLEKVQGGQQNKNN